MHELLRLLAIPAPFYFSWHWQSGTWEPAKWLTAEHALLYAFGRLCNEGSLRNILCFPEADHQHIRIVGTLQFIHAVDVGEVLSFIMRAAL